MKNRGVYWQLAARYEKHGWLERVGQGAFMRGGEQVGWEGGLYAVQPQLKRVIHMAGKTAFAVHGHAYFVAARAGGPVFLFGQAAPPVLRPWG